VTDKAKEQVNNENTGWLLLCHSNEENIRLRLKRVLSNENREELQKICSIRKEDIRKTINLGFCEIIGTKLVNSGMSFCICFLFNYDYYDYSNIVIFKVVRNSSIELFNLASEFLSKGL